VTTTGWKRGQRQWPRLCRAVGRFPFPSATKRNDWMIDRQVQKNETFTGIDGINTQDRAVQEGMGPIVEPLEGASRPGRPCDHRDKAFCCCRR